MRRLATVQNLDRLTEGPARIRLCDSFFERLRGFMFQRALSAEDGLLLVGEREDRLSSAIHMLFVPFDLAVIWIDGSLEVVDKVLAKAWHLAYVPSRPAKYVLEIHPSRYSAFEIGHKVEIIDA